MAAGKFKAFISYSRKDASIARWLHSSLEHYRLPGSMSSPGLDRRPLKPIFLDQGELRTSSDLGASIGEAIASSDYLIVLCSPAATASHWVNKEITEFLAIHDIEHIVAVIVGGEPGAQQRGLGTDLECFPPALRLHRPEGATGNHAREILAADLRPGMDGRRLVLGKVVATILDIELDTLIRRDARRQLRIMAFAVSLSMITVLVMGFLTWQAVRANEISQQALIFAEKQRVAAEGLIEFMLVELREKLQAVGRLDVLDIVSDRALEYYDGQSLTELDSSSLGRRARAMLLLGEVQDLRGNSEYALETFRSAAETTSELLKKNSESTELIFNHAQSVFWIGYIAWNRGEYDTAREQFELYYFLTSRLLEIEPDSADWPMEKAYALSSLGSLELRQQVFQAAEKYFLQSLAIVEQELRRFPNDIDIKREVAQSASWLATTQIKKRDFAEAKQYNHRELEIYLDILEEDPNNRVIHDRQLQALKVKALLAMSEGNVHAAQSALESALHILDELLALEPDNMATIEQAGKLHLDLARVLRHSGDLQAFEEEVSRCVHFGQDLLSRDPVVTIRQLEIYVGCQNLKARSQLVVAPHEAQMLLDSSQHLLADLDDSARTDLMYTRLNGETLLLLGEASYAMGDRERAFELWESALASLRAETVETQPGVLILLAHSLARLARPDAARQILAQLEGVAYKHPDFIEVAALVNGPD